MLVCAHDGGVDDQVFKVWILDQRVENALPHALLGPSAKALEHAVPVAELSWQVAPRCAGTSQPEHGIDEQAVVLARSPFVAFFTRNKPLDAPPLRVRKFSPNQDRPLSCDLESHLRVRGNPLYVNRTCPVDIHRSQIM